MDVAEQRPVTGKKSSDKPVTAQAKGAAGHAMAVVFIKEAEKAADAAVKAAEGRKDRLKRLEQLDRDSHLEFRRQLSVRIQQITDVAKGLGMGITEYMRGDGKSYSVYTELSMWQRMSRALETGWRPAYEKPWAEISVDATDARESHAAEGGEGAEQAVGPTARRGRPKKTNLDKAIAYLTPMPLHDLEVIHEWLGKHIQNVGNPKMTGSRVTKTRAASNQEQAQEAA